MAGSDLLMTLTGGQRNDSTQSAALIEGISLEKMIVHKVFDSSELIETVEKPSPRVMIPPRSSRSVLMRYDKRA